jgi:REP element-mobilizing transposase RayT
MPNHLHILLTAEKGSEYFSATKTPANRYNNISRFIGLLKQFSAKEIIDYCIQNKQKGLLAAFSTAAAESKQGHKYQVWQKRFHDEAVSRDTELITKLNYIHNNPLQEKWGLCEKAEEYQYSSARHYNSGEDVGIPIVKIV